MRKKDGFTILEAIIAIAELSIISVFILQMFISSAALNNRAKSTDIAMTMAITEIESLKKHDSLSDYLAANGIASTGDGAMTVGIYYDRDCNPIETGTEPAANADFFVQIAIDADSSAPPGIEGMPYGALYNVKVDVISMSSKEVGKTLASIQAKKYFPVTFDNGR